MLCACVAAYAVGTAGLNIFTAQAEGDVFLFLQPEVRSGAMTAVLPEEGHARLNSEKILAS